VTQVQALALSIGIEAPVALLLIALMRRGTDTQKDLWTRYVLIAVGVTLLTHPFAWTLNEDLAHVGMVPRLALIEGLVVFIEGLIYGHWGKLGMLRGFAISAATNALSFGVGLFLL
jgi:hypothetical protein